MFPQALDILQSLERDERLPPNALDTAVLDQLAALSVARQVRPPQHRIRVVTHSQPHLPLKAMLPACGEWEL